MGLLAAEIAQLVVVHQCKVGLAPIEGHLLAGFGVKLEGVGGIGLFPAARLHAAAGEEVGVAALDVLHLLHVVGVTCVGVHVGEADHDVLEGELLTGQLINGVLSGLLGGVVLLALTSNKGAYDFQFFESEGMKLYEKVLEKSQDWGNARNMMYVVGATKAEMLAGIRRIVPDHFLLVPGVGAQGGSLEEVAKYGMNAHCGLIVNSSRGIIFADRTENFAVRAREEAFKLQKDMERLLVEGKVL